MRSPAAAASLAALISLAAFGIAAGEPAASPAAGKTCRTAEVNPVTGHVLCIDPLGAEVAPAPPAEPCKTASKADGDWTFRPTCKPDAAPAKQPGAEG